MFWGCLFALLSCTSSPMLPLSRRFKVIWVAFPSVTSGVNGVEDAAEDGVKVMDSCPVRPWELGKTWGKSVVLQLPSTSYFLHVFCHPKKKKTGHGFGGTHCDHWNVEDFHLILRGKNLSHLGKATLKLQMCESSPPQTPNGVIWKDVHWYLTRFNISISMTICEQIDNCSLAALPRTLPGAFFQRCQIVWKIARGWQRWKNCGIEAS